MRFKQGLFTNLALASNLQGEPIWTTDTHQFYIGSGASKVEFSSISYVNSAISAIVLPTTKSPSTSKWLASYDAVTGAFTQTQPDYSDLTGTPSLNFLPLAGGTLTGDLLFSTDNTHDVGASGATRPRTIYVGTSVLAPVFNAATGFQIGGAAATSGHVLRANGTNYVDAQLAYGDLSGTPAASLPLTGGTLTGDLLFSLDNTHDIGASGATRPRTVYVGTSVLAPLFNAATGFQVAGAATTGHVLRGNGTNFVDAALAAADLSNGTTGSGAAVLAGDPTFTGNIFWGGVGSELKSDQGGAIELGLTNGLSKTPYIDFHFHGGTSAQDGQDYNVRLINDADGILHLYGSLADTSVAGTLSIQNPVSTNYPLVMGVAGTNRFRARADGFLAWDDGGNTWPTNIFNVGSGAVGGLRSLNTYIDLRRTDGDGNQLSLEFNHNLTNTVGNLEIWAKGQLRWGPGTSNADVAIGRDAVGVLAVNDGVSPTPGYAGLKADFVNVVTGFRVGGAATSGHVLRGNGTNFVDAALQAGDLSNGVTGSGAVVLASAPLFTSYIGVNNTKIDGPNQVLINGSTYTTIGSAQTANEGLAIVRDNDNGGAALIIYDAVVGAPLIVAQVGTGTTYTTNGSPGATQVDLQFNGGLIQAKAGASRTTAHLTVKQLFG